MAGSRCYHPTFSWGGGSNNLPASYPPCGPVDGSRLPAGMCETLSAPPRAFSHTRNLLKRLNNKQTHKCLAGGKKKNQMKKPKKLPRSYIKRCCASSKPRSFPGLKRRCPCSRHPKSHLTTPADVAFCRSQIPRQVVPVCRKEIPARDDTGPSAPHLLYMYSPIHHA